MFHTLKAPLAMDQRGLDFGCSSNSQQSRKLPRTEAAGESEKMPSFFVPECWKVPTVVTAAKQDIPCCQRWQLLWE